MSGIASIHTLPIAPKAALEDTRLNSRKEDKTFAIFYEVYGNASKFSSDIKRLINSWLTKRELTLISDKKRPYRTLLNNVVPFSHFVPLNKPRILKEYLGSAYRTDSHVARVQELVSILYESKISSLGSKYGGIYPLYPEITAAAMKWASNEWVVEIGGAHGVHAMLFGFTDALRVIHNDIDPSQMRKFAAILSRQPDNVQKKVEGIEGNGLNILEKRPELFNKVGLLICRNLIHFFNDSQMDDFFKLLHDLLKPGGRAIVTVISQYSFGNVKNVFQQNPQRTHFTTKDYFFHYKNKNKTDVRFITEEVTPCADAAFSIDCRDVVLSQKCAETAFKWIDLRSEWAKLRSAVASKIKSACQPIQEQMGVHDEGAVTLTVCDRRIFNERLLIDRFRKNGMQVEHTFVVEDNGHLVSMNNASKRGEQIGIIVKKPEREE